MNFVEINQILTDGPALKAYAFEQYEKAKLAEKRKRSEIYLTKSATNKEATVKQLESMVELDPEVDKASHERIMKEANFYLEKDKLECGIELARNERALMKNIEPNI